MAAGTKVGTGYVAIEPDFSGFQEQVEAAIKRRFAAAGDRAGRDFNTGISRRLRSQQQDPFGFGPALDRLRARFGKAGDQAGREIAARVGKGASRAKGDMFGLADAIAEVERRTRGAGRSAKGLERDMFGIGQAAKRAGRNLTSARTELRDWARHSSMASKAAGGLSNRLRGVATRLREAGVGARTASGGFGGLNGAITRFNRNALFFRNVIRLLRFPAVIAGVGLLTQSLSALAAGFVATAAAVGPLSGALIALPAAAAAAAQAFGALKLATAGVGDTIKAALDAQIKGGSQAVDVMGQQRAAADRVADAERAVADAQRNSRLAQIELTDAREDARRELEDMALAAERTGSVEEEAVLRVRQLRRQLLETALDEDSTELDIRLDENALKQAQFDLKQTRIEAKRTRADYKDAAEEGLKGMPAIVAARRAEAEAVRAEESAQRDLERALEESTQAMGAQGAAASKLSEEMGQLPPAAQAFVRQVVALKPKLDQLRATAASGLFPGVGRGLSALMGNFGVVNRIVDRTSTAFGALAEKAGEALGGREWGRDLEKIGRQNTRTINQMGEAGGNLADTFRHLLVAARPFINWLGKGTVRLTGWIEAETEAGRESGRLAAFFDKTKRSMQLLGPILKGTAGSLLNIGRATRPLGNEILSALGKSAEGFREWTGSIRGQNSLHEYFQTAKPAIFETGRLIRDLTKSFFTLGNQPGVAPLIEQVRTELLPALTDTIGTVTKGFGPALVRALTEGVKLLRSLSHQSGPLTVVAEALGSMAAALRWLVDHVPGVKAIVTALLVFKTLKFTASILGLERLGRAATATADTFRTAGAEAGTSFNTGLRGRLRGMRPALQRLGKGVLGAGLMIGVANAITSRGQGWNLGDRFQALASGVSFGLLHQPREIDERMATIIQRIQAWKGKALTLSDSARPDESLIRKDDLGDFTRQQRALLTRMAALRNAANRMFGKGTRLISSAWADPGPALQGLRRLRDGLAGLRSGAISQFGDIRKVSERNLAIIRRLLGRDTDAGRKAAAENLRATAAAFRRNLGDAAPEATKKGMAEVRRMIRRANLIDPSRRQAEAFGNEWAKGLERAKGINRRGLREMIREAQKMPAPMRKVALETWMAQLSEARRSGKIGKEEFRKYRSKVVAEFGEIKVKGKAESARTADAVIRNTERLVNTTGRGFDIFRDNTNEALGAFGVTPLKYKIEKFNGGAQKKQAGGFIVPGQGTGDTFRTALPDGSFVLNRNATKAFGLRRGGMAPVALEPGERVFLPDEVKRIGARTLHAANQAVQRFQTGGIVELLHPFNDPKGHGGGNSHLHIAMLDIKRLIALGRKLQQQGWIVNEHPAFGGVNFSHDPDGYHYTGQAVDVNWPDPAAEAGKIRALLGKLGALAKGSIGDVFDQIPTLILGGPEGPLRKLGQAALDKVRRGANSYVSRHAMVTDPAGMLTPFGGGGAGRATRDQMVGWATEALRRTGQPATPDAINKILTLAHKESGWEVRSLNTWDINAQQGNPSGGLMHVTLDKVGGSYARLYDPVENMVASIRYQLERYGGLIDFSPYAKGGLVRLVGDSLGVGTVKLGGLEAKIKNLSHSVLAGRTSAQGVGLFGRAAKQYIFDLGTNDPTSGMLASSLRAVDRSTGDRPVHALTVNSPFAAAAKNAKLRALAGDDINLIDWAAQSRGLLEADGVHATGAGYGKRAGLIAKAVAAATARMKRVAQAKKEKGKNVKGGAGSPLGEIDISQAAGGSYAQAVKQSLKRVRRSKTKKKTRQKQMARLMGRIKEQFSLDPALTRRLANYENQDAFLLDRADRADSLTFDVVDADGEPVLDAENRQVVSLGRMEGRTAAEWTQQRLSALIEWRNDLIEARVRVRELLEAVARQIRAMEQQASELRDKIAEQLTIKGKLADLIAAKRRPRKLAGKIRSLSRWLAPRLRKHFNNKKITPRLLAAESRERLRRRLDRIVAMRAANVRERNAIVGKVIPALVGRREALTDDQGTYEDGLTNVQGPGGGRERADKLYGIPRLGQFSGSIFDAHQRLNELNTPPPIVKRDDTTGDEPDHSRNLDRELFNQQYGIKALEELQKRISEGATRLVPFGGIFHTGDIVPGPAGQERMALVRSGEGVFTREQMAALAPVEAQPGPSPVFNFDVYIDGRKVIDERVEIKLKEKERRGRGTFRAGVRP